MPIPGAIIVPHPPLILPTVGRGEEKGISKTIEAYEKASETVVSWHPDTVVILSPHAVSYSDYFHISPGNGARGDMSQFRAPDTRLEVDYDSQLRTALIQAADRAQLRAGTLGERDPRLDHGTFIPLYFLRQAGLPASVPILRIGLSGLSPLDHYALGQCIAQAVAETGKQVAIVASGDLSHKLKSTGPYGYDPQGPVYDARIMDTIASANFLDFLTIEDSLCRDAADCGSRSFQIMAGALDCLEVRAQALSHEGPFGVGYGVGIFTVTGHNKARNFGEQYAERERAMLAKQPGDPWVQLARKALERYVRTGERLNPSDAPIAKDLPAELHTQRAGAFVSLHAFGRLRGCIGTTGPTQSSLAAEIVQNAISASTRDPRFPPVTPRELDTLEINVDVLNPSEPVSSLDCLDPKRYGIIVTSGHKQGLLLPDLEGVDTVEQQIDICRQKGGIDPDASISIRRFTVTRHR